MKKPEPEEDGTSADTHSKQIFKVDTPEVVDVLCLLSKTIVVGTAFDKFREN